MGKKLTDAKREAIKRYDAKNTKQIHLKLNRNTDAEMIEWLEHLDNVQGYIKGLIKKAMREDPDPNDELHRIIVDHMIHWGE